MYCFVFLLHLLIHSYVDTIFLTSNDSIDKLRTMLEDAKQQASKRVTRPGRAQR